MHSDRKALYLAPFHWLFHFNLACPHNLLWPFSAEGSASTNPILCDRCDGEGPIKACTARRVLPPALQSVAESCCGLIPGCHTLHCDPSVSVTLPALQQGKGNRHEGGRTLLLSFRSEKQERHRLCLAKAPLVFCHQAECELQHLIIGKRADLQSDLCGVVLRHQKKLVF